MGWQRHKARAQDGRQPHRTRSQSQYSAALSCGRTFLQAEEMSWTHTKCRRKGWYPSRKGQWSDPRAEVGGGVGAEVFSCSACMYCQGAKGSTQGHQDAHIVATHMSFICDHDFWVSEAELSSFSYQGLGDEKHFSGQAMSHR